MEFSMTIKGSKPQAVDFKTFVGLNLLKVSLVSKFDKQKPVTVTAQYLPPVSADEEEDPKPIKEVIAKFTSEKPVNVEFNWIDEQNLKFFTVDGAEVKLTGTFVDLPDEEEESEEYGNDEDDEDDE